MHTPGHHRSPEARDITLHACLLGHVGKRSLVSQHTDNQDVDACKLAYGLLLRASEIEGDDIDTTFLEVLDIGLLQRRRSYKGRDVLWAALASEYPRENSAGSRSAISARTYKFGIGR